MGEGGNVRNGFQSRYKKNIFVLETCLVYLFLEGSKSEPNCNKLGSSSGELQEVLKNERLKSTHQQDRFFGLCSAAQKRRMTVGLERIRELNCSKGVIKAGPEQNHLSNLCHLVLA